MGALISGVMAATAAPAQTLTAEQAMKNYRDVFAPLSELDCPESDDPDEIIVCGRAPGTPDPNRLPLPVAPLPGARNSDRATSAADALNRKEGCSPVGLHNGCGGTVPVFQIIGVAVKAVRALIEEE